ncbi:unnamed protein product [Chondrus crispus]|uniref:THUMP domain-containing protein n=1 Tax=Chondrus crispus TaxID=2769 RepID=R7Q191_CHOCR|nr:unnamed protein product [Chondrus crispus]CDF32387.1 unnamed protein product [Chondrus crispus]|eukprot:XP_005712052.1 unnamed protein product [Chondrus crispus]
MGGDVGKKRRRNGNRNRHDRNKFRRTINSTQHRKDLGYGLQGILISCTPRHENHAFREAVIMLGKYCENSGEGKADDISAAAHHSGGENQKEAPEKKEGEGTKGDSENKEGEGTKGDTKKKEEEGIKGNSENGEEDLSKALQAELKEIRDPKQRLFTRIDGGVNGCIFIQINRPHVDLENVVECALKDARASGSPNSRHCIRIMPIHSTCYAKPEDAAKAAVEIVKKHFPPMVAEGKPVSYAISFRSRLNTSAHREEFIKVIAKAIEECEPRYKVNLTSPDVTLIVEVMKTSCCIGTFRHYYQLAKMNLREAACPSKPKEEKEKQDKEKSLLNATEASKGIASESGAANDTENSVLAPQNVEGLKKEADGMENPHTEGRSRSPKLAPESSNQAPADQSHPTTPKTNTTIGVKAKLSSGNEAAPATAPPEGTNTADGAQSGSGTRDANT